MGRTDTPNFLCLWRTALHFSFPHHVMIHDLLGTRQTYVLGTWTDSWGCRRRTGGAQHAPEEGESCLLGLLRGLQKSSSRFRSRWFCLVSASARGEADATATPTAMHECILCARAVNARTAPLFELVRVVHLRIPDPSLKRQTQTTKQGALS